MQSRSEPAIMMALHARQVLSGLFGEMFLG
jgi:hypothetical protein